MARDLLDLGSWCILRMSSADTLKLARSLARYGLEVWTPIEQRISRKPTKARERVEREHALMPSYVFGHVQDLPRFLRLAMNAGSDYPKFTVFRSQGGIPLIGDDELDALRAVEADRRRAFDKSKRKGMRGPIFSSGAAVRVLGGGFEGLAGVVEGQDGQFALVSFSGFHSPIKVRSILLEDQASVRVPSKAA
jgi:hypothetical protein